MAYKHGVYISEVPTSVLPPVTVDAGIPFVVGTSPIGYGDETNVNRPVLCRTYAEAVKAFGYAGPKPMGNYGKKSFNHGISEAIYVFFSLYNVAPVIMVNVLDPAKHYAVASTETVTLDASTGSVVVQERDIFMSSVSISNGSGTTYSRGTDYDMEFDDNGFLVITSKKSGGNFRMTTGAALTFTAHVADASQVTASDIIGGIDAAGNRTGMELIEDCFSRFRLVPGTICTPGFFSSTVKSVAEAKCRSVNGLFRCVSVVDIQTENYSQAVTSKNGEVNSTYQISCWPRVSLDGVVMHLSTHIAAVMCRVDSDHRDIPYASPSNNSLKIDATCNFSGAERVISVDQANYLNGNGIVTALNFLRGWVAWGNRTSCYPGVTDPKDSFIPIRRMYNWIGNTIVQTFWQKVDYPLNRRLVDTVVDSVNIWLNGLAAQGAILGGRLEFVQDENPTTSLIDGIATFHLYVTPPAPARELEFVLEYDVNYLETLFS